MEKIKCITFDKEAQDALPEDIKAKMKADRDEARRRLDEQRKMDNINYDPFFKAVAEFVVGKQDARASGIQLKFMIGYNRTGRILDQMEDSGIVGERNGIHARKVLVSDLQTLNDKLVQMELGEQVESSPYWKQ